MRLFGRGEVRRPTLQRGSPAASRSDNALPPSPWSRGLHVSASHEHLSRGAVGGYRYSAPKPAQVEIRSGQVEAPAVELPARNDWDILAPPPLTIFCGE